MTPFPALITVPHGGGMIPPFIKDDLKLSDKDLFEDGDPFTQDIYDVRDHVTEWMSAEVARAVVDLNRPIDDFPPHNPDGVVKSHTCHGVPIYKKELLEKQVADKLLEQYYVPFHDKIKDILERDQGIRIAFDCHSMSAMPPKIAPDSNAPRPTFCLGNNFGKSCPDPIIEKLAECLAMSFGLSDNEIAINKPFAGGFITRTYGMNPIPWIQIEMNRKLYLNKPWFDSETRHIQSGRLQELRDSFLDALTRFFGSCRDL